MSQPFYQPARQNFSFSQNMQQPQGFGGGQGFGSGQNFGGFGGFGGGAGFGGYGGGFQPQGFGFGGGYGGGFGGGFNPYQGGFGGFGGFGGGYNPMFGGIGGLGFNPMMGPQFGMPMGGFNPYQPEMLSARDPYRANESGMPMPGPTGRESFDNPRMAQQPVDTSVDAFKNSQEYKALRDYFSSPLQYYPGDWDTSFNKKYEDWKKSQPIQPAADQQSSIGMDEQARRLAAKGPMYGGIGGLGFNPMMGPQFGMPMQEPIQPSSANETHEQYTQRMKMNRMLGFVAPQSMDRYSPMMEPQFGMPILQGMQAEQTPEAARRAYMSLSPEARAQQDRVSAMSMPERQMYYQNVDQQAQAQSQAEAMRYLQSRGMFA